jgi:glutamate transport system permease protein
LDDLLSNFDLYLRAFGLTVALFVVSGVTSLLFGALLASLRVGPVSVLARAATVYVTIVRNTPLLMIFIFMAVAGPRLGYTFTSVEDLSVGDWNVSAFFFRSCVALTLYTSAFVCEAFRSGINAVPIGQAEAARSIGLTFTGAMRQVILPQAIRAAVPPLVSVQIALLKNTSVAAVFGLIEAAAQMKILTNNNADQRWGIFLAFAVGYIVLVELVSLLAGSFERRWRIA